MASCMGCFLGILDPRTNFIPRFIISHVSQPMYRFDYGHEERGQFNVYFTENWIVIR